MTYLITGATGNVGSKVVAGLIQRGDRPRIFVRDTEKARSRYGDAVDIYQGDLADTATLIAALDGVDALFLVNSGHELAARDAAAAKAAKTAGVRHLVKLSSLDATHGVGTGVWHAQGEEAIRNSGITFTFVQPTGFMSNAVYWARSIRAEGVVRSATGAGKIPFIHSRDIADVVVSALTSSKYEGESLPITGPEALSYAQMTAKIGAAIGRELRFEAISEEQERQQQTSWGAPVPLIDARLSIFRAIREGRLAGVTDTVERVLGRKPFGFNQWVQENAGEFGDAATAM